MIKKYYSLLIAGILSASISMSANAGTEWTIKTFENIALTDINNLGQVTGTDLSTGENRPFLSGSNGEGIVTLEFFGISHAINDSGQLAGVIYYDSHPGSYSHAFITGSNGTGLTDLGTLGEPWTGRGNSIGLDINSVGQVMGNSSTVDNRQHAFITGHNGIGITDLGTLGGKYSTAEAINESGQVVGISETVDGSYHAFITAPNGVGMKDLGNLNRTEIRPTDINDLGEIVGYTRDHSVIGNPVVRPFITGPNGENMTDLGNFSSTLGGPVYINNSGQIIINTAEFCDKEGLFSICNEAFLYEDGKALSLSSLPELIAAGFNGIVASGINDNGQIIGAGLDAKGSYRSFLLTPISPVPEPSTYAMLLTGLGLFGLMAFRRSRSVKLASY